MTGLVQVDGDEKRLGEERKKERDGRAFTIVCFSLISFRLILYEPPLKCDNLFGYVAFREGDAMVIYVGNYHVE